MAKETDITSLERGARFIRRQAKSLPDSPGVYRMLSGRGEALYVGKARSLKKRVTTYANTGKLPVRLQRMVALTEKMEFVHTHTEVEALLLESNLIKKLKPRFNVLLRDDKSFPYILMTGDHPFPQVVKHRGAKNRKGDYFGPFAGAGDVNRTIIALQKAFMLRNCTDNVFARRTRPCLQYHIKRCTAPCVGYVDEQKYAAQVGEAQDFLRGKSHEVQERLIREMENASKAQDYETAARYRDRIRALTAIQARQTINVRDMGDADVMAVTGKEGKSCIQVFFFRGGQNFGNRSYFPRHAPEEEPKDILSAFMAQFYENKPVPPAIIVNLIPRESGLLEEALSERLKKRVTISCPQRGTKKELLAFVERNAGDALDRHLNEQLAEAKSLERLAELFGLDEPPRRIEVYDNSHVSGTNMVGAMIVAGPEGFCKNAYRKFNIKQAEAADDYGMMREVMTRRFGRALKEGTDREGEDWPDLLLIDGGPGQYSAVMEVLEEMGIADTLTMVAISKGPDRHAGREKLYTAERKGFQLPVGDPLLHYLQRLRDEAHRFAIGAHRTRRKGDIGKSPLDDIPGIGAKRKKALLHRYGSAKEVARAGVRDLAEIEGISEARAQEIYDYFHQ